MLRALILLPAFLLTGCADIDFGPSEHFRAAFHETFDLQPGGRITLENANGSTEISGWDENKVEVDGEKYASSEEGLHEVKIDMRNHPDLIEIRTIRPSGFGNTGARYTIRVPRSARLDGIRTSNGRIEVRGLDAGVRLRTSNGAIHGEQIRGAVEAETSNGAIELRGIEGGAHLRTSNGGITLELAHPPTADIRAETSNGPIAIRLPRETAARLDASTSNSRIDSEFELKGNIREERHRLAGDIGSSETMRPLIDLHTSNGHISIRQGASEQR